MTHNGVYEWRRHDYIAERTKLDDQDSRHGSILTLVMLPDKRGSTRTNTLARSSRQPAPVRFDARAHSERTARGVTASVNPAADARAVSSRRFRRQAWWRAAGNFALLRHRSCDGFLVSMHQSGTHWLKYMLANALAREYGVAPPRYNHANDLIGGPRDPIVHPQIPRLLSAHSLPHPLMRRLAVHRLLALPKYLVLVRDLRASLVSNYVKWAQRYAVPFSTYLQGDPRGKRYNSDIWWSFRFLNAWGDLAERLPERVCVVHYEDLQRDPRAVLGAVTDWFGLELSEAALAHGIGVSSKAAMAERDDPARPAGAVRQHDGGEPPSFDTADRALVETLAKRHLVHDFGYDLSDWSPISSS